MQAATKPEGEASASPTCTGCGEALEIRECETCAGSATVGRGDSTDECPGCGGMFGGNGVVQRCTTCGVDVPLAE